jgi:hypothetical protein
MDGYLDHVLRRALGHPAALRPRPRSRFEPATEYTNPMGYAGEPPDVAPPERAEVDGRPADFTDAIDEAPPVDAVPAILERSTEVLVPSSPSSSSRVPVVGRAAAGEPAEPRRRRGRTLDRAVGGGRINPTISNEIPAEPVPASTLVPASAPASVPAPVPAPASALADVTGTVREAVDHPRGAMPVTDEPAVIARTRPAASKPRAPEPQDTAPDPILPTGLAETTLGRPQRRRADERPEQSTVDVPDEPEPVRRLLPHDGNVPDELGHSPFTEPTAPVPVAGRRRTGRSAVRVDGDPAPPPPVVNVTIGRVEVRQAPAVPAPPFLPAPPAVPAPPGPRPMSLDEYLDRS